MDLQSLMHAACRHTANGRTGTGSGAAQPVELRALFTARELEVLGGLAAGLSVREIALRLMLFEPAVRAALQSIYQKLDVRSREEAVAYATSRRTDS